MDKTEKYRQNYLPGFDCRLATFRNNLAYYDINLTNGMMLGLSGALMFRYGPPEENMLDLFIIAGVSNQTLENLASNFSTHIWFKRCSYDEDIFSELRETLEQGFLINALVNRPYLNHIRFKENEEYIVESYNIGHHYITITDIDDSNNVTVFETDNSKPFILSFQQLKDVWFFDKKYSRHIVDGFLPCNGYYYYYSQPKINAHKNIRFILCSIEKVVEIFFQEIDKNTGLLGLKRFFSDVKEWKNKPDMTKKIIHSLVVIKVNESLLSGGGLGRKLYSYFLTQVAELMSNEELKIIATQFNETAQLWKKFVIEMTTDGVFRNQDKFNLDEVNIVIQNYASKIMDAEVNQMSALKEWLKKN